MLRLALAVVLAVIALAPSTTCAQRLDLSHGRGFVWHASANAPVVATTVRYAGSALPEAVVAPGGGVEARIGIELDSGLTLEIAADIDGHAVDGQSALVRYRGSAQARMPFDLGGDFFPYVGVGVGLALFSHAKVFSTTMDVRGLVGVQWWPEPWFGLDLYVGVEVTPPGFVFTDTVVFVTPGFGVSLAY